MIEVSKSKLMAALSPVSNALGRIMPIYENILISVDGVSAVASNGEFQIMSGYSVETNLVLVDGKKIVSVIKNAAKDDINIDIQDSHIIVKSGRGRYKINTKPPADFPIINGGDPVSSISINQMKLKHMISSIKDSMADNDARYYLNGMHFSGGENLTITATDGHRLAQSVSDIKSEPFELIIPRSSVLAIDKLLVSDDMCEMVAYRDKFTIATGDNVISINCIDGKFPDTKPMLSESKPNQILVNGKDLKSALARTMIATGNELRVDLDLSEKGIAISASNKGDEASDFVEIESFNGEIENTALTISGQYLNNALTNDVVEINFGEPMQSVNVVSDANHIIMPMKR